jgi:phospholipid/cholesterol/gamma-HCH transport system permease protein
MNELRVVSVRAFGGQPWRSLGWFGAYVRQRLRFALALLALSAGVVTEGLLPQSWRRSVRGEFRRVLRLCLLGSLQATIFVAALIGIGVVYEAIYWLRVAGQEGSLGTLLVVILMREVAPLLVGVILLGRSGAAMLTELGALQSERQLRALQAQGIDPFHLLVLPRGVAFALAAYTLGMIFVLVTLVVGFAAARLLEVTQDSFWAYLDGVLRAATPRDFIVLPLKMLVIGLLVGTTGCLTALLAQAEDESGRLIARGFIRGMLAIMLASGLLSLAI